MINEYAGGTVQRTGAHRRQPAPVRYRPGEMYFRAGMLLIFTFGISLAGIEQAYRYHDWTWFTIFVVGASIDTGLYFWIVHSWLTWINLAGD